MCYNQNKRQIKRYQGGPMFQNISSNYLIDITTIPPSYKMKRLHEHNRYELFFMIHGNCTLCIENDIYKIESGTIVLIPSGCNHKTTYLSGCNHSRIVLYFDDEEMDWLKNELESSNYAKLVNRFIVKIPDKRIAFITNLLHKIAYEARGIDSMSRAFDRTYFYQLILFLLRCHLYKQNIVQKMDISNEQIQKIIEFIIQNYSTDITLASTAKLFNMSESNLSKRFKTFTGYRFRQYLIDIRIRAAAESLLTTNMSITDISMQCGFSDSNSFGDTFKRIYGTSPSGYRKRF